MRVIYGFLLLFLITIATLQALWFIAVPLAIFFSIYYHTKWLVLLAFLLDGYFGSFASIPILTLVSIGWFIVVEIMRPRLRKVT